MWDLFIPAVIVLAGYVWLVLKVNRTFHALREERFKRTNSAGVLEFDTYEGLRSFEKREGRNSLLINLLAVPGGIIPLVSLGVIFSFVMMTFL